MLCHICSGPATGQCTACWRFYCAEHGEGRCDNCREQDREQMPGAFGPRPAATGGGKAATDATDSAAGGEK